MAMTSQDHYDKNPASYAKKLKSNRDYMADYQKQPDRVEYKKKHNAKYFADVKDSKRTAVNKKPRLILKK